MRGQVVEQRRLPDTRLAAQDQRTALSSADSTDKLVKLPARQAAADQSGRSARHRRVCGGRSGVSVAFGWHTAFSLAKLATGHLGPGPATGLLRALREGHAQSRRLCFYVYRPSQAVPGWLAKATRQAGYLPWLATGGFEEALACGKLDL